MLVTATPEARCCGRGPGDKGPETGPAPGMAVRSYGWMAAAQCRALYLHRVPPPPPSVTPHFPRGRGTEV